MPYTFVIERDDGSVFYQDSSSILELIDCLGEGYLIVDIFDKYC